MKGSLDRLLFFPTTDFDSDAVALRKQVQRKKSKDVVPTCKTTDTSRSLAIWNLDQAVNRTVSGTEMAAMSTAGSAPALSVLFILAGSGEVKVGSVAEVANLEALEVTSYNLLKAAVPMSASDVLAVSVGEAIAGVIGASASYVISFGMKMNMNNVNANNRIPVQNYDKQKFNYY
jgi:hypothetical protein